jgi:hypothetical protein
VRGERPLGVGDVPSSNKLAVLERAESVMES